MPIDVTKTIAIEGSPAKLWGLAALGVLMTGLAAVEISGVLPDSQTFLGMPWGWINPLWWIVAFGVPFFGLCTVIAVWRALKAATPVLVLSPEGLLDTRIASEPIPWTAVRNISTWSFQRQKVMVLDVDPAVEQRLPLSRVARTTRAANRALGADGLCVAASGLKWSYDQILEASTAYAKAAAAARR